MKSIYKINNFELLKDWSEDEDGRRHFFEIYERNEKTAKKAARRLLKDLEILHGSDLLGGLAYTSTSEFAALWNCNTEARKRGTALYFKGVALTTSGDAVAVYTERTDDGDEGATVLQIIGGGAKNDLHQRN